MKISLTVLQVVDRVEAYTVSPKVALYIRANGNFTDQFGVKRYDFYLTDNIKKKPY